ncbi:hypothetical protein BCR42DRAFT_430164 [Absidia repens]|uniref:Uncharacterized protein n=1 Tax=Absidia repens TaxID=90262 RepID=A0A1X2HKG2_9FUNG|nr:hypothetical protein BCR42DRAFT_430164 [Absidia repens]
MLFQFLSDWKRQPNTKRRPGQSNPQRSSSMTSIESFPNSDSINWHDCKQTWSFEADYESFPSLESAENEDNDQQLQLL